MPDDAKKLTIVVAGKGENVAGPSFVATLRDLIDVLTELDHDISGAESPTVEWDISDAHAGSPLTIELTGKPLVAGDYSAIIVGACLDGLESLESGSSLPASFGSTAAKRLYQLVRNCENGIGRLEFSGGNRKIVTSEKMLSHVPHTELLSQVVARRKNRHETGELEGRVETVSSHTEYYFNLWETVSGRRVKCRFGQDLREDVRIAWEKRAIVSGKILFSAAGFPLSMEVKSVRIKPDQPSLPQFKDQGIDITGGIESSAFVRGMRDDD